MNLKCIKASRCMTLSFPQLRGIAELMGGSVDKGQVINNQKACEFLRSQEMVAINQDDCSKRKPFYEVEIQVTEDVAEEAEQAVIDPDPEVIPEGDKGEVKQPAKRGRKPAS